MPALQLLEKYSVYWVCIFFILVFLSGLNIYKDYGISWDEHVNRRNGAMSAIYVNGKLNYAFLSKEAIEGKMSRIKEENKKHKEQSDTTEIHYDEKALLDYTDKDYGVFFDMVAIGMEAVLKLEDTREIYFARHLLTFLFFYTGLIFFYLFLKTRFEDWKIALLGCLLLLLSPRIFAETFYNSKDIVLMSMFIISSYTLIKLISHKTYLLAFFHALASALVVDTRIVGILVPAFTLCLFMYELLFYRKFNVRVKKMLLLLAVYICLLCVFTVLLWPYLWENPLENFILAFNNMKRFRWPNDNFYLGQFIPATQIPWHYIPVWMGASTPVIYLLLFPIGLLAVIKNISISSLKLYQSDKERMDIFSLLLFFLPVIMMIILHAVLYDGWRHLYFTYPSFIFLVLNGLIFLGKMPVSEQLKKYIPAVISSALAINLLVVGKFMYENHPYQQIYFNFFAGKHPEKIFERDYWGLSYRQALEHIFQSDTSPQIAVYVENAPGKLNAFILPKKDRERINFTSMENAKYFLTNFRWREEEYNYKEVYSIYSGNVKIMAVYQLK